MNRRLAYLLILMLVFTLIHPAMGAPVMAQAENEMTVYASNSKTVENYGGAIDFYEPDMQGVIGEHVHHVGYEYVDGLPTVTRSVLQFDLGGLNSNRRVEVVELQFYQKQASVVNHSYLSIWGSRDTTWNSDTSLPSRDVSIVENKPDEHPGERRISFDVTSYVLGQLAGESSDKRATFLFEGATAPENSNFPGLERYLSFYSKEHNDIEKRPRLIITYSENSPPSGSLAVEGNGYSKSTMVQLRMTAVDPDDDPMEMDIYNEGEASGNWEPFQAFKEWELIPGDGEKIVYMQLRDDQGHTSDLYSATVILDTVPPTVSGVADGGVYNTDVTIRFNEGTAKLNGLAFNNGGVVSEEGSYRLIVTDVAGNETRVHFKVDKTPPTGTLLINNGSDYTNSRDVQLQISGVDPGGSTRLEMRFSNTLNEWEEEWEILDAGSEQRKSWVLSEGGSSEKTIYMQLRDEAGNTIVISATITYKTIPLPTEVTTVSGVEDEELHLQISDFTYENADETDMHSIKIVGLPEYGELWFGSEKVTQGQELLMTELEQQALIFIPEQDWYGITDLTWQAGNGYEFSETAGRISIVLDPVNDAPIARDIKLSIEAGRTLTYQLEAYDVDNDVEELRYKLVSEPTGGTLRLFDEESGIFEYVTGKGEYGTFIFTYQVYDGELYSNEATVEIEVTRLIIHPPPVPPTPEPPKRPII